MVPAQASEGSALVPFTTEITVLEESVGSATTCVGHFDIPQCVEICPVSCIPKDLNNEETKADLFIKYKKLTKNVEI
mgnify:CR=1 FL=1